MVYAPQEAPAIVGVRDPMGENETNKIGILSKYSKP